MTKVLFVCHGNICRSPMGEFVLKHLVSRRGIERDFYISSAATSNEEVGKPTYHGTLNKLRREGVPTPAHRAVQITRSNYDDYDYILCMERCNVTATLRIVRSDPEGKIRRLLDFTDHPHDIDDPWYTGDFDTTYEEIMEGCEGLLRHLGY